MPKRKHHLTKKNNHSKIDPMSDDEIPSPMVIKKGSSKIIVGAIVAVILILIVAGLRYYGFLNFPFFKPNPESITRKKDPHALDTCDLTKEDNSLVENLSNQAGVIQGSLKGYIVDLSTDEVRQSIVLQLTSPDKSQQYKLSLLDQPNFIINAQYSKIASSSALKKDQLVRLTFNCNPETNLLEFTRLTILPSTPASAAAQPTR